MVGRGGVCSSGQPQNISQRETFPSFEPAASQWVVCALKSRRWDTVVVDEASVVMSVFMGDLFSARTNSWEGEASSGSLLRAPWHSDVPISAKAVAKQPSLCHFSTASSFIVFAE